MVAVLLALFLLLVVSPPTASDGTPPAPAPASMTGAEVLLRLKASFTNASALASWTNGSSPCDDAAPWTGVFCYKDTIVRLRLVHLGLSGDIDGDAFSHLSNLRGLSLNNNNFSGPIPSSLAGLGGLRTLFLSQNSFSGPVPGDFFAGMRLLKKLWLDHNRFDGPIPSSIANASELIELHLDHNGFQGPIPAALSRFPAANFAVNPGLCGAPLNSTACPPAASPSPEAAVEGSNEEVSGSGRTITVTVVVSLFLLALVAGALLARQHPPDQGFDAFEAAAEMEVAAAKPTSRSGRQLQQEQQQTEGSSHVRSGFAVGTGAGGGASELVVVNGEKGAFGLPDLMKASAEVLGNGGLGSAYRAVMASGVAVAVKRMHDMNRVGKDDFDEVMRRLGRIRHPNVLTPLAYHFRKEEKLIVSEYVPRGSLLYILHGDRGPDHMALNWATRLKIVRGITRGLAHLHAELPSLDAAPHGNFKSGNVLLGPAFEPLVADHGLLPLVNPSVASHVMFAYRDPEALVQRHVSPGSDVYCLGVVILELLTGKFPSQYLNNTRGGTDVVRWATSGVAERREAELLDPEIAGAGPGARAGADMVRLLRLGVACTEATQDRRPTMLEVAAVVEEIAAGGEGAFGPMPTLRDGYADGAGEATAARTDGAGEREGLLAS